jgi:hypothetical protein
MRLTRIVLALIAPLLLASCLLSPGRFLSTLDIRKDRSFTFTYVGEVIVNDPQFNDGKDAKGAKAAKPAPLTAEAVQRRKEVAEALSKEQGYRSVEYVGGDTFKVDYSLSGTLDRSFVYPVNLDATAIIPWLVAEVRKDGSVRIKAPGFGDMKQGMPDAGPDRGTAGREGTFTLTTDANLVMQNNEDGLAAGPPTRVVWKVTPTTTTTPTAVIRF